MTNDADAGVLRIVIVTGDVMISGRIARRICVSLYRMHLLALYGPVQTGPKRSRRRGAGRGGLLSPAVSARFPRAARRS